MMPWSYKYELYDTLYRDVPIGFKEEGNLYIS